MLSIFVHSQATILPILSMAAKASVTEAYSSYITSASTVPSIDSTLMSSMNASEPILNITFEILAAVLALVSIIFAYLQLLHMRRTPPVDGEE
jgi:hypothetical protein